MDKKKINKSSSVVPTRWNQVFLENFQKRLDDFRWNASQLAKKMKIDNTTVGHWLNGVRMPRGDYAILLSQVLECSMDWLFKGLGPEPAPPGQKNDQNKPSLIYKVETHPDRVAAPERDFDPHGGWQPRPEMKDEDHNMLGKAFEIIRSNTIYRAALRANINAFHAAITGEQKLDSALKMIKDLEDRLSALEKNQDPPKRADGSEL